MDLWPANDPDELSTVVSHFLIYPYTAVSVAGLLVYEYFLTLDREVEYIWKMRLSWGKLLFLINRYVPFGLVPVLLHGYFIESNPGRCRAHVTIAGSVIYVSYVLTVVILLRRAYIAWERNRIVGGLITFVWVASTIESAYMMNDFFKGVRIVSTPIHFLPCVLVTLNDSLWTGMVNLLIMDVVALGLLLVKSFMHFRTIQSDLMQIMVRDGIGYFLCNMGLSITNLIIIKSTNPYMNHFFAQIQCVLQSILCNRLLLHLHVLTSNLHDSPPVTEFSSVHFTETFTSLRFRSQASATLSSPASPPESPWSMVPLTRYRRRPVGSSFGE